MVINILRKTLLVAVVFIMVGFSFLVPSQTQSAGEEQAVHIYFFWGEGCPHCLKEKTFLLSLEQKYPGVTVHRYEVYKDKVGQELLVQAGKALGADVSGIPFTVVGDKSLAGWQSEGTTGAKLEKMVTGCLEFGCSDVLGPLVADISSDSEPDPAPEPEQKIAGPDKISVPILGDIDISGFSLPVLTIILAALDGFNPCAMWALLFLITLLLGMKDRKKIWILGVAFLLTSAISYFIFMAAWLNLLLFIGFVFWIRLIIGLVALGGGSYNIREFFQNKDGACKVTGGAKRQEFFQKLKNVVLKRNFWLALAGIITLGFAVNLVELICSAGLPAVYTQILTLNDLSRAGYYGYISLYILIFLLDDLLVFFIAMITLKITGVTSKYARWSYLIGGILMLIIGLLLIFKPEILMFG
jgi:thiol-disulfide isomerase/thioredoxin